MKHELKQCRVWPWRAGYFGVGLLIAAGLSQAQMGPGGGGGGGGGGKGGSPSSCGKQTAPAAACSRTLDDLMPPDPWRIWQQRLLLDAPALGLRQEQLLPFNDFVRELGEASQLKSIYTLRSMHGAPQVVSAVTNVARDLRLATEDAREWVNALQDLDSRWQTLRAVLSPTQQAQLDASYTVSREAARTHTTGAPADGQVNTRNAPPR